MSKPSILVVDDDPSILHLVAEILADEGYPVTTAENGAAALDCMSQAHPELVLLDMRMPVMDGWGFARALDERGIRLPVVVMTAARDARQWSREIGASGWVAKPFDIDDLLQVIEDTLKAER